MKKQNDLLLVSLLSLVCFLAFQAQAALTDGLIAYYPFTGNANDVTGAHNGTVFGATLTSDRYGRANQAYSFNGVDTRIVCPDTSFPSGNASRTISLWILFQSYGVPTPNNPVFISYGNEQPNDGFYGILMSQVSNNPIAVGNAGGGGVGNNPQWPGTELNRWYHVAFSHDGSQTRLYIDGVLRATTARSYATVLNGDFNIGMFIGLGGVGGAKHHGFIDDVRVYDRALSSGEVAQLFASEGGPMFGLVAYLPFNGNANDESGNGNNGTVHGATLTANRMGAANTAYQFNGVDDYIEIQDSTAFKSQDFSISMWFKPERFPNIGVPVEAADFLISKGQNNFEIATGSYLTGDSAMMFLPRYATGNDWSSPAGTYQTNIWQHVVAIYQPSANQIHFYINGVETTLNGPANKTTLTDNSLTLKIGIRQYGGLAFKGSLDDLRIYNRALSPVEVTQLAALEGTVLNLVKAVKPTFLGLLVGQGYQLQLSGDLVTWTNQGATFTATNAVMPYPQYWDVDNWGKLFFRLEVAP